MERKRDIVRPSRTPPGEVLVAILNTERDLEILRKEGWYRIPVSSAQKWLRNRWPPKWIAFYQTKVFDSDAYAIRYYARVATIRKRLRSQLLPDEPNNPNAGEWYYQVFLAPLERLPRPIPSRSWRRIVFIPTTWRKFSTAKEVNDLYDESPLEDLLWEQIKRIELTAERQEFITANKTDYALDFAFYCAKGKLDVETDGDTWHADPERIPLDNRRDNDLETSGWSLLRFNGYQLHEEMTKYCVPTIVEKIRRLGGLAEGRIIPRDIRTDGSSSQLSLFDD